MEKWIVSSFKISVNFLQPMENWHMYPSYKSCRVFIIFTMCSKEARTALHTLQWQWFFYFIFKTSSMYNKNWTIYRRNINHKRNRKLYSNPFGDEECQRPSNDLKKRNGKGRKYQIQITTFKYLNVDCLFKVSLPYKKISKHTNMCILTQYRTCLQDFINYKSYLTP